MPHRESLNHSPGTVSGTGQPKLLDLPSEPHCPFHVSVMLLPPGRDGRKRTASGRGLTRDGARRNALWEAAERSLAIYRPDAALRIASLAELGTSAVDPASLILLSRAQYDRRAQWNEMVAEPHRWPEPFDPRRRIGWARGRPLAGDGEVWVPAAATWLGYEAAAEDGFAIPDSNGLAAGSSRDEAIARALLETIERDAVSVWWYNRLCRPELKLAPPELPVLSACDRWLGVAGRRFWLLDLTADLGVPVGTAVSCNDRGGDLSIGFGAGRTYAEAAFSAIGEMAQFDINKKLQSPPDASPYPNLITLLARSTVDDLPFLRPDETALRGPACAWSGLADLCARMKEKNLAPIIVDFPAREIFAVRVIVPHLRPIWPRFAPGRLYEVPVALGWKTMPTNEQDMNPMPILY